MSKRTGVFDIQLDLKDLVVASEPKEYKKVNSMTIEKALEMITRQMTVSEFRICTISDYNLHMNHFRKISGAKYVDDMTTESVHEWLRSMEVSDSTELIRLKCFICKGNTAEKPFILSIKN